MLRSHTLHKLLGLTLPVGGAVVAALVLMTTAAVRSAQNPPPLNREGAVSPPAAVKNEAALTTPKQQDEPKNSNLEKTKTDAAELCALADKLHDELNKINVNILSLDIIQKTEDIEKLAKKIKGEATEH